MNREILDWQFNEIDESLIKLALQEDLGTPFNDVTCELILNKYNVPKTAKIISKHQEPMVICGINLMAKIAAQLTSSLHIQSHLEDGQWLLPGQTLLTIESSIKNILMLERTLLNFLRHLCAIATLTRKFVDSVTHTSLKILDTRKTTPGMRHLEKYAVVCGGGINHRMGLYDAIMIKDTHIDLIGELQLIFNQLPDISQNKWPVIVEVRNHTELENVLFWGKNKISRILLDNMSIPELKQCVQLCKINQIETEASGNINLSTIKTIADTGVDYASIGMLTHSAGNVDLSMKI